VAGDDPDGLWMAAENSYALTRGRHARHAGRVDGPQVVIIK
jgi:hypothetical protein